MFVMLRLACLYCVSLRLWMEGVEGVNCSSRRLFLFKTIAPSSLFFFLSLHLVSDDSLLFWRLRLARVLICSTLKTVRVSSLWIQPAVWKKAQLICLSARFELFLYILDGLTFSWNLLQWIWMKIEFLDRLNWQWTVPVSHRHQGFFIF